MIPTAIQKAESLLKFAQASGEQLGTFAVTLTDAEAYELLDHLASGALGMFAHHDMLVADVAAAKRAKDPWTMLAGFDLCGLSIARVKDLN